MGRPNCRTRCLSATLGALVCLLMLLARPGWAAGLQPVTLQLKWHHQFQFAGYYAAQEKGYYRAAGLDVRLVEAGPGTDPVDEVVAGRAEYGVGSSALVLARQQGKPVVALAAIFQHSPLVLLARSANGIHSVHDLAGKRIMLEPHAEELLAYLKKEGIPPEALDIRPHSFDVGDLTAGKIEVQSAYLTDEPFQFGREAEKYPVFSPRTGGIDFYGDTLFTSERQLKNAPERTAAFRRASLQGWQYAMQHPEEIVDLILARYGSRHSREQLLYEAARMAPLIRADAVGLGYMYPGRWQHIVNTYAELGLMTGDFSLHDFLYDPEARQQADRERLTLISQGLLAAVLALTILGFVLMRRQRRTQHEIETRTKMTEELRQNERKFRFITENSGDVIWMMDIASGRFTYLSPSVHRLRGYTAEEIMADPALAAVTPESAGRIREVLADSISRWHAGDHQDTRRVTEVDQLHKDGRLISTEVVTTLHGTDEDGPVSVLGITRDITERKKAEAMIRNLAFFDPLTQLPNRRLLLDRMSQALALAVREKSRLGLMFIDLDHFKPINDELGHDIGDWLLQAVARRMCDAVRASDTVARIGGDEFIVLLAEIKDDQDALAVAEKMRLALCDDFVTPKGRHLNISCSIGIAIYPEHGDNERELLKRGDDAMYQAKAAGRNQTRLAALDTLPAPARSEASDEGYQLLRFHWKPSYECGEPSIDHDHRELFAQANQLIQAGLDSEPDKFAELVDALLRTVGNHFADEEAVLRQHAYAAADEHAQLHHELVRQALDLRARVSAGHAGLAEWIAFLANDVVAGHMLREDRKFFPLFKAAADRPDGEDSDDDDPVAGAKTDAPTAKS